MSAPAQDQPVSSGQLPVMLAPAAEGAHVTRGGSVMLGSELHTVEVVDVPCRHLRLRGPRGALHFLRPITASGDDTGLRQIVSARSGQPMHQDGHEIRAVLIGDVIEQHIQ